MKVESCMAEGWREEYTNFPPGSELEEDEQPVRGVCVMRGSGA